MRGICLICGCVFFLALEHRSNLCFRCFPLLRYMFNKSGLESVTNAVPLGTFLLAHFPMVPNAMIWLTASEGGKHK